MSVPLLDDNVPLNQEAHLYPVSGVHHVVNGGLMRHFATLIQEIRVSNGEARPESESSVDH